MRLDRSLNLKPQAQCGLQTKDVINLVLVALSSLQRSQEIIPFDCTNGKAYPKCQRECQSLFRCGKGGMCLKNCDRVFKSNHNDNDDLNWNDKDDRQVPLISNYLTEIWQIEPLNCFPPTPKQKLHCDTRFKPKVQSQCCVSVGMTGWEENSITEITRDV